MPDFFTGYDPSAHDRRARLRHLAHLKWSTRAPLILRAADREHRSALVKMIVTAEIVRGRQKGLFRGAREAVHPRRPKARSAA